MKRDFLPEVLLFSPNFLSLLYIYYTIKISKGQVKNSFIWNMAPHPSRGQPSNHLFKFLLFSYCKYIITYFFTVFKRGGVRYQKFCTTFNPPLQQLLEKRLGFFTTFPWRLYSPTNLPHVSQYTLYLDTTSTVRVTLIVVVP